MKNLIQLLSILILASGMCLAQTSAFTYQGKLASGSAAVNGNYQFEFKLFDSDLAGNQVGTTQVVVASVQNGIFTTQLDFGVNSFPADAGRWLEISVRPNESTDPYTVLTPRQQINSVPFAIRSLRATDADNAANATHADNAASLGGVASGNFVQTTDARLADARPPAPGSGNYIQNSVGQQAGNFNISGNAVIGGTLTPNVGDVVRLSSSETDGWKIAQNAGQSIFTGTLGLSGNSWTAHESPRNWSAVASSADGSKLVAVVELGQIYTSTDSGVSWTARNAGINGGGVRRWSGVASSADGVKLVAVVSGGPGSQIYTSPDSGATWTPRASIQAWSAVASSAVD
jgi:hypothetical protein